jgi:hypothetical protein
MPDRAMSRDPALFGKTMVVVACAAGCFALGCYAGRGMATGVAIASYLAALCCLVVLRLAARRSAGASAVLLAGFAMIAGAAAAPTAVYYSPAGPRVLWEAAGGAGLLTAACGVAACLTLPGLPLLARLVIFEVVAILLCGIVLVGERLPSGAVVSSAIAAAGYAAAVIAGFSLLRRLGGPGSARLLAAGIVTGPVSALACLLRVACRSAFPSLKHRAGTLAS